jgi:DNA anti-recombination protein RmuC
MSATLPPSSHEPSNAELMVLLRHIAETSEARDRAQTERAGALRAEVQKLGSQFVGFEVRLAKLETDVPRVAETARAAHDSQAELEGSLLREVGALAANDRKQNAEMATIRGDVATLKVSNETQNALLARLAASVNEIITWKRAALLLVSLAPGGWLVLQQLLEHWK